MAARTRTRLSPIPGGGKAYRTLGGSVISDITQPENSSFPAVYSKCDDHVNERDKDNPLTIRFESRNWIPLNGEFWANPSSVARYTNYFPVICYTSRTHPAELLSSLPSVSDTAIEVLARSNPTKPYVSIPNFLYELKDLPEMIRDIGRLRIQAKNLVGPGHSRVHPSVAASHYLSYEMGWKPLIEDLKKLLDFQSQVNKRYQQLNDLYNNGGLQRRVRSPQWMNSIEQTDSSSTTFDSVLGTLINGKIRSFHTVERWGTVRWYPSSLPDGSYDNQDLARLARDLTFGMKGISPKQAWDAIPWTWMIGWFTNFGTWLQAHNNSVPLSHSTPCIMTHRFSRFDFTRTTGGILSYTGGTGSHIIQTKERVMDAGLFPSASIPFLRNRHFSILAALHLQRRR